MRVQGLGSGFRDQSSAESLPLAPKNFHGRTCIFLTRLHMYNIVSSVIPLLRVTL